MIDALKHLLFLLLPYRSSYGQGLNSRDVHFSFRAQKRIACTPPGVLREDRTGAGAYARYTFYRHVGILSGMGPARIWTEEAI